MPNANQGRAVAREMAQSSSGIGLLQSTVTGNSYMNGLLVSQGRGGSALSRGKRKLVTRRGGRTIGSSSTITSTNATSTQESQAK